MGTESRLDSKDNGVDKIPGKAASLEKTSSSQAEGCDSTEIGAEIQVGKCIDGKTFPQAPLDNKKGAGSLGGICDLETNRAVVAETITQERGMLELSTSSIKTADEVLSSDCQTPRECVFDPFAPGQEEKAVAPKKAVKLEELPHRRHLNFALGNHPVKNLSDDFDDAEEEDRFLRIIGKMLLDLVISNQALEATAENLLVDPGSPEGFRTPTSAPILTGAADTCPDAPLRSSLKAVRLSPSICRKLDFEAKSLQDL